MRLAKPRLDLGMFTNDLERHASLWNGEVGIKLDLELPLPAGWVQYRFDAHGSVVKVNHWATPLPQAAATGYTCLTIARAGRAEWEGRTVEGDLVRCVAPGTEGIVGIGVTVSTPRPSRMMEFYVDAMEFEPIGQFVARCGDTLLFVEGGAGGIDSGEVIGPGYRYLTVQIFDADRECNAIVNRGGRLAQAPINYGDVARAGFVKDPDGNWIEVSARTSLTGIPVEAK